MDVPVFSLPSHRVIPSHSQKGNVSLTCYPDTFFSLEGLAPINEEEEHMLSSMRARGGAKGEPTREVAIPFNPNGNPWVREANKMADAYENSLPHILPEDGTCPIEHICKMPALGRN